MEWVRPRRKAGYTVEDHMHSGGEMVVWGRQQKGEEVVVAYSGIRCLG